MKRKEHLKIIQENKQLLTKKNQHVFDEVMKRVEITEIAFKDSHDFLMNFMDMLINMQSNEMDSISINTDEFSHTFIADTLASYSPFKRYFLRYGSIVPAILCFVAIIQVGFPFIVEPMIMGKAITMNAVLPLSSLVNTFLAILALSLCFFSLAKLPGKVSIQYYILNLIIGVFIIAAFIFSQLTFVQPVLPCNLIVLYVIFICILIAYFYLRHHYQNT